MTRSHVKSPVKLIGNTHLRPLMAEERRHAGVHGDRTVSAFPMLAAGLHQIVVQYFQGAGGSSLDLAVTNLGSDTDVSSSFVYDPAGPCNADCATCNTGQQFCEACTVSTSSPVGGVCPSPLSVT